MQGIVSPMLNANVDPLAVTKRVYFRPATSTDTVRVGDAVCYNSDVSADYKERTTQPSSNGAAYAEGSQNYTGRFLIVEQAASGNIHQFAGIVAKLGPDAGADGDLIEIFPLVEGALVPVYTDANCTLDETVLGVATGAYALSVVTGDGDPLAVGVAAETVDRSSTNGLVWVRLFGKLGLGTRAGYMEPIRPIASGYAYGLQIEGTSLLRGTAASKSYVVQIGGDRESSYVATGDSNDAILKITGNNYAACDSNYIIRGLNAAINQRSGGVCGRIEHSLGTQNKSGGTTDNLIGLTITAENYGTMGSGDSSDGVFGGLDIVLKNEAAVANVEFGIRIRNENNSIAGDVETVFDISETGANTGFTNLLNIDAAATVSISALSGDKTFDTNDIGIPISVGGSTYYIIASDSL